MVAVSALPSTGFQKNAAQPFCCARSCMTISCLDVVTMIGGAEPAARSRCCSSMPDMPGRCTSTTMHVGAGRCVDVGFRRLEVGWLESRGPEKTSQRRARRGIILDDSNEQGGFD